MDLKRASDKGAERAGVGGAVPIVRIENIIEHERTAALGGHDRIVLDRGRNKPAASYSIGVIIENGSAGEFSAVEPDLMGNACVPVL